MMQSKLLASVPGIRHRFGTKETDRLPDGIITARQVHGTEIFFVEEKRTIPEGGFDILITDRPGVPIAVKTADCLPILIVEAKRGIVAAVHAGWRGTLKKVVERAVDEIVERGGRAGEIYAAMGPCIEESCLEVGCEISPTRHLNLQEINRLQMIGKGVRPERIDRIDLCSYCRADLFFSYRREGEKAGRMVNFIQLSRTRASRNVTTSVLS